MEAQFLKKKKRIKRVYIKSLYDKLSVSIQTQQKETRGCLVDVFVG